jgi:arylformamidase
MRWRGLFGLRGGPAREEWRQALRERLAARRQDGRPAMPVSRQDAEGARPAFEDLAYGPDPLQRCDVYLPAPASAPPALVVYLHGGGWRQGDKASPRLITGKARHWLSRGLGVVSINYRLWPQVPVQAQCDDVTQALAWVREQCPRWGADPSRLAMVGHSAGAHLAAMAHAGAAASARPPWKAVVLIDTAALDMVSVMQRPHYAFYDPVFGSDPAAWAEASPLHRMRHGPLAPVLLVCSAGREDSIAAGHAYRHRALSLGGEAELVSFDLDHRQLNDELGRPGPYTDRVDGFLATHGIGPRGRAGETPPSAVGPSA